MSVFRNKHRGNRWSYDFWQNSRRYQGYCIDSETGDDAKSKSQAKDCEAAVKREVRAAARMERAARSVARPGTYTFGEAVLGHIDDQPDSSPAHIANLHLYARELLEFFGHHTPVITIDQDWVKRYRRFAARQKVWIWKGGPRKRSSMSPAEAAKHMARGDRIRTPESGNHYLDCLRGAFNHAHGVKDPVTGQPMLPFPPKVDPLETVDRKPRPMPDAELYARLEVAPPWVVDAAELARNFGLRISEALTVTVDMLDHERKAIRFDGRRTKSGDDEFAYPIPGGWAVALRLERQARARRQRHLVTWPGPEHWRGFLAGESVSANAWRPLKRIRRAWRTSAKVAGISTPHRYHDVRARYITEVAKVASSAITQKAARHADAETTAGYTGIASEEVAFALKGVPRAKKPALRSIGRRA